MNKTPENVLFLLFALFRMGNFLKKVSENWLVSCAMSSHKKVKLDGIPFMTA